VLNALDIAVKCVLDRRAHVMTLFGPGIFILS
jgi:hypothetical protein